MNRDFYAVIDDNRRVTRLIDEDELFPATYSEEQERFFAACAGREYVEPVEDDSLVLWDNVIELRPKQAGYVRDLIAGGKEVYLDFRCTEPVRILDKRGESITCYLRESFNPKIRVEELVTV